MASEKSIMEKLPDLLEPFPNYKWKVQTAKDYGCQCVAYIDARDVQDRLDAVVGPENWQVEFETIAGLLFAKIGIHCDGEWVWKSDVGTESNTEKEKGQVSDAFKRAAVHWGIGRFLYGLPLQTINSVIGRNGKYAPADDNGKVLYGKEALTEFIEKRMKASGGKKKPAQKKITPSPTGVNHPSYNQPTAEPGTHPDYGTEDWKKGIASVYALAAENGLDEDNVHAHVLEEYGKTSMKELSVKQLRRIYAMIKGGEITG